MSDYSAGALFKTDKLEEMKKLIKEELEKGDYILYPLNNKWHGLFPMDMFLMEEETIYFLKEVSKKIPLLYFLNCEDHDWGYNVYVDGEERASCMIPVYMDNPESCISAGGPFVDKVNIDLLKVFDIDDSDINELGEIINFSSIEVNNSTAEIRDKFMSIIGIKEFEFMSYTYLIDQVIDDID